MSFLPQNAIYLAEDKEIKEGSQELVSFTLPCSDLSVQAHNEWFTALLLTAPPDIFRATFSSKEQDRQVYI